MKKLPLVCAVSLLVLWGCDAPRDASIPGASAAEATRHRAFSPEQEKTARATIESAREIARFEDEEWSLTVHFNDFIFHTDPQTRYRVISNIADADAVLHGRARTIRFYDPDGKHIGQADPHNGVRLLD